MCKSNNNDYSLQFARNGIATISTANSSLLGDGTITTVFTAGKSGAIIKSVTIKAINPATTGMVRLFIHKPVTLETILYKEVQIPVTPELANTPTPTPVLPMFETVLMGDLELQNGFSIKATTQTGNSFAIIVEALDWEYPVTLPDTCCNFKQVSAITGVGVVNTANTLRNGSGNIVQIIQAPAPASSDGTLVKNVTIKALGSTSINGMIRLFISPDGTTYTLLREIPIPQTTQSAYEPSYKQVIEMDFNLEPNYVIGAATQNGESFGITIEGEEWSYPI
jgi:hypothetical protein